MTEFKFDTVLTAGLEVQCPLPSLNPKIEPKVYKDSLVKVRTPTDAPTLHTPFFLGVYACQSPYAN